MIRKLNLYPDLVFETSYNAYSYSCNVKYKYTHLRDILFYLTVCVLH